MMMFHLFLKRAFDIAASLIAILLLLPLWIAVAVAIKCDSKGPVFFCQERLTKNGRCFRMYKFRSMVVNASIWVQDCSIMPMIHALQGLDASKKLQYRRAAQLINVIKGDLSVVGPRPPVSYELGDFNTLNKRYKKRFFMRGGIKDWHSQRTQRYLLGGEGNL
jgi:lipopolysaccharide/colanic/teichoic acid biosynthesis glycosyltransferase